jgi:hypothetical protein
MSTILGGRGVIGRIQYAKSKVFCIDETYVETYGCIAGGEDATTQNNWKHICCITAHITSGRSH